MPHLIRAEITVETDDLQGYSAAEYIIGLKGNLSRAIGDGMLTGATPEVEIDGYRMSVTHNPESRLDEIEAYYAEAIESGRIRLEDLPGLLASNGLNSVSEFSSEMAERLGG
jgi:hypothetical protein